MFNEKTLLDLFETERQVADLKNQLVKEIETEIGKENYPGTKMISNSPIIYTIKLSEVIKTPGHILSPDYYNQKLQARAVKERLSHCTSITTLMNAISHMLKERRVVIGKFESVLLNPYTLKIIAESPIGKLAIKNQNQEDE